MTGPGTLGAGCGPPMTRRSLLRAGALLGAGAAAGLTACGGGGTSSPEAAAQRFALVAGFPQTTPLLAAGVPSRLPYLIADRGGELLSAMSAAVTFTVSRRDAAVGDPVTVVPHADGVPRAYLPLNFTFPEPGIYDVSAEYEGSSLSNSVQVYTLAEMEPPVVGEPMSALASPTTANPMDVDPLCSLYPNCPFHEIELRTAVGSGRTVVLLIASPAYGRSHISGPILQNLMAVVGDRSDVTVLHNEVYVNPKEVTDLKDAVLAPVPKALGLDFEPVMYVINGAGAVTARADIVVDRTEMAQLIG